MWLNDDLKYFIELGVDTLCFKEETIRLSNQDSKKGRIEICLNGYWGTVCSNGWDERDALVACKQAGYQSLSKLIIIIIILILMYIRSYTSNWWVFWKRYWTSSHDKS